MESTQGNTQDVTWKTLIGKNHGSPQTPNYHNMRKVQSEPRRQRPRALYLCQPAVTPEYHPISHTLSLCRLLYNSYNNMTTTIQLHTHTEMIALSHIYTYMNLGLFTNIASIGLHKTYLQICLHFRFRPSPLDPVSGSLPALTGSSLFITGSHPE